MHCALVGLGHRVVRDRLGEKFNKLRSKTGYMVIGTEYASSEMADYGGSESDVLADG